MAIVIIAVAILWIFTAVLAYRRGYSNGFNDGYPRGKQTTMDRIRLVVAEKRRAERS